MIAKHCFLPLFIIAMVFHAKTFAQPEAKDTSFYKLSLENIYAFYDREMGANLSLYNGTEYVRIGSGSKGSPFFESDTLQKGSIIYDGRLYLNVAMQYDLVQDGVIITDYSQNIPIKLISDKVVSFSIFNHTFIYIDPNKNNIPIVQPGFYDQLFVGKVNVFAKREKKVKNSLNAEDNKAFYVQYNTYYLEKDSLFHIITNQKNIFDLLTDKREELKRYIKTNKIDFKRNEEEAIIKIAAYYTQLKS